MSNLLRDARYGLRLLIRRPGFTAVAVDHAGARDRCQRGDLHRGAHAAGETAAVRGRRAVVLVTRTTCRAAGRASPWRRRIFSTGASGPSRSNASPPGAGGRTTTREARCRSGCAGWSAPRDSSRCSAARRILGRGFLREEFEPGKELVVDPQSRLLAPCIRRQPGGAQPAHHAQRTDPHHRGRHASGLAVRRQGSGDLRPACLLRERAPAARRALPECRRPAEAWCHCRQAQAEMSRHRRAARATVSRHQQGLGRRRDAAARGRGRRPSADADDAARRGRTRAPHRVRQRREHAPGARNRSLA